VTLGRDLAEAEEMAALAMATRVRTAVGLQARAAPAFRYLKISFRTDTPAKWCRRARWPRA